MQIEDYQGLAMRTSPEGHDRLLNGCMGLIGESGEVVDVVKKWKFQSGDNAELPMEKLIDELADILWYCAELATGLHENLADIFKKTNASYDVMREYNEEAPLELTVMRLADAATKPMVFLFDGSQDESVFTRDEREAIAKSFIIGIMTTIRDILEIHCGVSLEDAMEHNIEKLRKRYPDGFDPERSLHRTE